MSALDDVWAWLYDPLQDLKRDYLDAPDKSWDERRALFLKRLGIREPDEHPVVGQLILQLDAMSEGDRNSLLGTDQLDTLAYEAARQNMVEPEQQATPDQPAAPEQQGAPEQSAYNEGAWHQFLATNGPAWDGSAASWGQFREWFLYYAADSGFAAPATGLLDYLDAMSVEERIATFAQYGVTIAVAAPVTPAEPVASEQPVAAEPIAAEQPISAPTVDPAVEPASDELIESVMAELIAETPEFADIPEERQRELLAEVLSEL